MTLQIQPYKYMIVSGANAGKWFIVAQVRIRLDSGGLTLGRVIWACCRELSAYLYGEGHKLYDRGEIRITDGCLASRLYLP